MTRTAITHRVEAKSFPAVTPPAARRVRADIGERFPLITGVRVPSTSMRAGATVWYFTSEDNFIHELGSPPAATEPTRFRLVEGGVCLTMTLLAARCHFHPVRFLLAASSAGLFRKPGKHASTITTRPLRAVALGRGSRT